jgi:Protein of unknown function (DUF2971)
VLEQLDPEKPEDVYICCFCENGNLLSQWRGYGADGSGVSIAFKPDDFSAATGGDMSLGVMRFWKVYYEKSEQTEMVRNVLEFSGKFLLSDSPDDRARKVADIIKFFIPTFKHEDFWEETEWRLIFTPGPPEQQVRLPEDQRATVEFRVARQMLVPYYSFRKLLNANSALGGPMLDKLPISKVMVGPSSRAIYNRDGVRMLLQKCGYPDNVELSKISYRA